NYVAGAIGNSSGDSWGVQKDYGGPANYIYSQGQNGISLSTGQAYQYNFTGLQANYVINGNVQYNGAPVSGVGVYANATINGLNFNSSTDTDTNGNYSLAVGNGSWSVSVNCNGGNDSLDNIIGGNYQCPNNQNVTINNGNGTANFNVQSGGGGNAATIQGYVSDTLGNPVSVNVYATNGLGSNLSTSTDGSGYYEFTNLSAGNWDVSLDCGNLSANGYGCVNAQQTYVSGGQYDEVDFTVPDCGTLQVYTTFLPDGLSGSSYSAPPLQNIGCNSPFTWSLSPGSEPLPPGLTISSGGVISGTPGSVPFGGTTYYFSVRVTDGTSTTADQSLNITVYPVLTIGSNALPNGTVGIPYSAQVLVSGGDQNGGGYGFFYNGSLPPGLNVNSGAITSSNEYLVISGTPTNVGTFTFTLSASDDDGNSVQRGATIRILSSSLSIVTTSLSNATVNANYSYQLQASGGTPPYSWTVAQGSQPLPTGLTLATNGLISGIPTVSGTNSFIVRVTDQNAVTTTRSLTLVINGGSNRPSISAPARLASQRFQFTVNGTAGQNYTIQYATGLRPGSSNWISLLVTNSAASSFTVTDTNASNNVRFYRVMVGP
ncbi:MAG TPA: putative Ig domain-containing protein, partial [Verrucomicrobiae bacterium]|nr:putative Ig domain-containing protein [Verrucomicrobiae bacterium]